MFFLCGNAQVVVYQRVMSSNDERLHSCFAGAVVCATLLDRLKGDQITASHEQLKLYSDRPQELVSRVIKKRLGIHENEIQHAAMQNGF